MNKLALGTVQFGLDYGVSNKMGQVTPTEANKILTVALDNKINTFDTAMTYGESETILGQNLENIDSDIITKISIDSLTYKEVEILMSNALSRLKKQNLYAVMLHNSGELLAEKAEENFNNLKQLKNKYCRKIGVSVYNPDELIAIINRFKIDIVQVPLNILDQRFLDKNLIKLLKKNNIEIHARSLFLQGLLLMDIGKHPKYFTQFSDELTRLNDFSKKLNLSKLSLCLAFAKACKDIDKFVIGTCSETEIIEIIENYKSCAAVDLTAFKPLSSHNSALINPTSWPK